MRWTSCPLGQHSLEILFTGTGVVGPNPVVVDDSISPDHLPQLSDALAHAVAGVGAAVAEDGVTRQVAERWRRQHRLVQTRTVVRGELVARAACWRRRRNKNKHEGCGVAKNFKIKQNFSSFARKVFFLECVSLLELTVIVNPLYFWRK